MFSPTLIVQTIPDYSVIVSKCRFYILRKKNESSVTQLAAINEKIEIEREDNVSVEVFNPGNSFIESDKLFTFERNKLNIYDLEGNLGEKYKKLESIGLRGEYPPECLYHLIDDKNFIVINPHNKQLKYIIINTNEIKMELKIENLNRISAFFVTKNSYLAFHDDEEKRFLF